MDNRSGHFPEKPDSLKPIQRASDDGNILFHYAGIDLSGFHIGIADQFLNSPIYSPRFQANGWSRSKAGQRIYCRPIIIFVRFKSRRCENDND